MSLTVPLITERLERSSSRAAELRDEARQMLIDVVADAHQLGMSQRQIAIGLGRSQPEISRLLGLSEPRFMPTSDLGRKLVERRSEVTLAMELAGITNIRVFGSLARGDDNADSDIDLLVDIPDDFSLWDLTAMKLHIERILEESVDIVPARGLKGAVRQSALKEAISL
jgi:predicted nucleotidyltransferase